MSLDFDPIYLIYILVAASAGLFAEGVYLLCFTGASYRHNVNRRLKLLKDQPDREAILVQLRRERGLTGSGNYSLRSVNLNQLVLQSGLTVGIGRLATFVAIGTVVIFIGALMIRGSLGQALFIALLGGLILPVLVLRFLRKRRQKAFGAQFPDALDMIVRSLRAGHPVPIAISMVAREMKDPIGSEFGIVADEITYGADLESGLRNLYFRVGQDDLPLFVTAVAIQGTTGGNLGEILQNLSAVIRERFKMRRKIRALAAEARASALILSSLPIVVFAAIQFVTPDFYASVWDEPLTKKALALAGSWMMVGNFIMYRLVNFRI
ncbi:MAG TPA: type II secretion system F family protein [Xanthobacteraceae bacterium]|jgi:tight adherence protein B|nr:type II secretion system F family protein [Xanthobacteraceae bacterium]